MRNAAAVTIASEADLAAAIDRLLADPGPAAARAEAFARQQAEGILVAGGRGPGAGGLAPPFQLGLGES